MLKAVLRNCTINKNFLRRSFSSRYESETIAYNDPNFFPPESGPIQRSKLSNEIVIPKCRLDQYVWENFAQWQNKTAVACGVTGRNFSYAQLRDKCARFAINLQKFGLKKDDVVGICMPNAPEFMISALGIMEAGCTVTSFNPAYTPNEISRQIVDSNAKLMICWNDNYENTRKAVELSGKNIRIICAKSIKSQQTPEGAINFDEFCDKKVNFSDLKCFEFDLNDTAFLPYLSGTTGLSKGVMLSHRNLISNCEQAELSDINFTLRTTETSQEVILAILPLYHIYAWTGIFNSKLRAGAKVVTVPGFTPETFIKAINEHKVSFLCLVPPLILFIGHSPAVKPEYVSHVRRIICGAAPLGAKDAEAVLKKAPKVVFNQGFGMTETSACALLPYASKSELASAGFPVMATEAKIVALDDPTFKAQGPNVTGELFLRGPQMMKGYLNNEKATKETLVANKWLKTGDIAYYNEEGKFYITDRLKELIKVKGYQVPPAELEEILRTHPNIAEAAVVGVPNEVTGEKPRAFVVAKPNMEINETEVLKFLADKVARYKIPDQIVSVKSIPKNPSGKILRRQVKIDHGII